MDDDLTKGTYHRAYYDDLRAPAVAINPPGADSDPGRDATTGWLLFDRDATELIYITYQMPHGWVMSDARKDRVSSPISFHVHWHKSTSASGTVAWRMRYRYANIGSVWSGWSDPETVTVPAVSDGDTAEKQALTAFTPIRIPNAAISANLLIELARVGSADTYAADAVLTDADCHILINQPGSIELYEKYDN